jgi:hypothetical protein
MKISEFKIFLDNFYTGITEYIERFILIFSNQIPDNMELGDIIFLSILKDMLYSSL